MKKGNLWLGILAITLVLGMAACGGGGGDNDNDNGKTVTSIVITSLPTKTTYEVGDKFDTSGLVVKAYYSDGTNQVVTGYTTDFDSSIAGTKTVSVSYGGKTAATTFPVRIYGKGGSGTFNTIYDFEVWLTAQPNNTATSPHTVKLNLSSLEGGNLGSMTPGSVGFIIEANKNKYLSLDLSGSSITRIGNYSFMDCINLTGVTIPDSVTSIGGGAFLRCINLTRVNIPTSVTSIESATFSNCSSLASITIPDSVTSIGGGAFGGCTSLTGITIPKYVNKIEDVVFYRTNLTSITIHAGITSIGKGAFRDCPNLTSVTFQGLISSVNLASSSDNPFDGNLRDKYLDANGGIGTYVRVKDGSAWTKQ